MSIKIKWKHNHVFRGVSYKVGQISDVNPSEYQTLVKAFMWATKHEEPEEVPVVIAEPEPEPEPELVVEPEPEPEPEPEMEAVETAMVEPESERAILFRIPTKKKKNKSRV